MCQIWPIFIIENLESVSITPIFTVIRTPFNISYALPPWSFLFVFNMFYNIYSWLISTVICLQRCLLFHITDFWRFTIFCYPPFLTLIIYCVIILTLRLVTALYSISVELAMFSCLHRIINIFFYTVLVLANLYNFVIECSVSWFSTCLLRVLMFYGQLQYLVLDILDTFCSRE